MAVLQNVLDTFWDGYKLIQDPMIFTFMLFLNSQGGNLWKKGFLRAMGFIGLKLVPIFLIWQWLPDHEYQNIEFLFKTKLFLHILWESIKNILEVIISIKTRWIWCWIAKITCTRKVIKICENQRNFKILTLKFCWSLPEKTINILMSLGYHPEQA